MYMYIHTHRYISGAGPASRKRCAAPPPDPSAPLTHPTRPLSRAAAITFGVRPLWEFISQKVFIHEGYVDGLVQELAFAKKTNNHFL